MERKFADLVDSLHPSFERLIGSQPHRGAARLPLDVPSRAVYLFSEGDRHLYVGRTNRLRHRHREHWAGKHNDAPFAFKIARRGSDEWLESGLTRSKLSLDLRFSEVFGQAKERVAAMDFRWVEEIDPNRQCLLEIYCSVVLWTEFNDFENH